MRARPIVVVQPGGQRLGAVARRGIGAAVGPLAQEGLDEALRFAVRARGVGPGAEVAHTSTAAEAGKKIPDQTPTGICREPAHPDAAAPKQRPRAPKKN